MSENENLRALQRAADVIRELRSKLDDLQGQCEREPIVIVSTACRFPGGANTPERFWTLLERGDDATREVPRDRWDVDALYDPERKKRWSMYVNRGGFLDEDPAAFDVELFGVSPREARSIDPQQRMLLEVAWEALENACIPADRLEGSRTGVYVGLLSIDYGRFPTQSVHPEDLPHTATGMEMSFPAGRLSYHFGLRGPSMVVASACSASLVAVHQAAAALRNRECDLAIAGGVNLMLSPEPYIVLSKLGAVAPDGRSKTFDDGANGYGRGEGIGVVLMKRLSDALRDGNPVLAVVSGSAVNHDGSAGGISVPNGVAQQEVIRSALAAARAEPADVEYVEAHGTGTSLGDPIELDALSRVYGSVRPKHLPLIVGSLKSNIGHLEGAAGVASVIKMVESLRHERLAPHIGMTTPSSHFDWERGMLRVADEQTTFSSPPQRRMVGVSAFGLSGINAHVLLSDPRSLAKVSEHQERTALVAESGPQLVLLSAKSRPALADLVRRYRDTLAPGGELAQASLANLAYTSQVGRAQLPQRLALSVSSLADLHTELEELTQAPALSARARVAPSEVPKVAFMFSGQGSQYVGMGRELYGSSGVFRASLERTAQLLSAGLDVPLLDVMFAPAEVGDDNSALLHDTGYTQPALLALELALAAMWREMGVEPSIVLGHSVGELAAAYVAGVFSLEDVCKLVGARARLMAGLPRGGEMWTVFAPRDQVEKTIRDKGGRVSIAATNGPANVVLSGDSAHVREVVEALAAAKVRTQQLTVSHAFHSAQMDSMLAQFDEVARTITYAEPSITMISNVTGEIAGPEVATPEYWVKHVRSEVRFADGVMALAARGASVFLEVGPRPALLGLAQGIVSGGAPCFVPSLRKNKPDPAQVLDAIGELHGHGVPIAFASLHGSHDRRFVRLPNYPFQHQRFWIRQLENWGAENHGHTIEHALLGERVASPSRMIQFQHWLDQATPAFMAHHEVYGSVVMPGAAYIEMALAGGQKALGTSALELQNVSFHQALELGVEARRVTTLFTPTEGRTFHFEVSSLDPESSAEQPSWTCHASGKVRVHTGQDFAGLPSLATLRERCRNEVDVGSFYRRLEATGVSYGASFRAVRELYTGEGQSLARIVCDPSVGKEADAMCIHPTMLDACLQAIGASADGLADSDKTFLPVGVDSFSLVRSPGRELWVHTKASQSEDGISANLTLLSSEGEVLAVLQDFRFKAVTKEQVLRSQQRVLKKWLYSVAWEESPIKELSQGALRGKNLLVFGDRTSELQGAVIDGLSALGARTIMVERGTTFKRSSDALYCIDTGEPTSYAELLKELAGRDVALDGVVLLWSLNGAESALTVARATLDRSAELLALAQALVSRSGTSAPRLWVVTRSALAGAGASELTQLSGAALWGLSKVLVLEHPELRTKLIDLPRVSSRLADHLVAELLAEDPETCVALRDDRRIVPRLQRDPGLLVAGDPVLFHKDATYLVTGGAGALGSLTARFMGERGAGCVALMSRRGRAGVPRELLAELEATGARVVVCEGDVGREADVVRVLAELAAECPPLRGIVHSAGSLDDGVVLQQTRERFKRVFASKVDGAMHLHNHTKDLALDHFILYSSAAAVMGRPGQANYVAANAFLDELAHHRRSIGLPALSINWGGWRWVGLAAERASGDQMSGQGMSEIEPEQGLMVLEMLMRGRAGQAAVMPIDFHSLGSQLAAIPMFSQLLSAAPDDAAVGPSFLPELLEAPPRERAMLVRRHIEGIVMKILGIKGEHLPSDTQKFSELGMDSLMSVELRNRLQHSFERVFPGTMAFDHPSLSALSTFVSEEVLGAEETPAATEDTTEVSADVAKLIDDVLVMDDAELTF